MFHSAIQARALVVGGFALAATLTSIAVPASAQSGGFYRAELAAPLDAPRKEVLNGVVWRCEGASCTAPKASSRAEIVCGKLARKVGAIASFSHGEDALDDAALSRCNKG